jgi:hypothetical protein
MVKRDWRWRDRVDRLYEIAAELRGVAIEPEASDEVRAAARDASLLIDEFLESLERWQ